MVAVFLALMISWVGALVALALLLGVFWLVVWLVMRALDKAENKRLGLAEDWGLSWTNRKFMERYNGVV